MKMNGNALLAEYRARKTEMAFAELVRQYTGLVYSVAYRRLSDWQLAEDVVQGVFTRLATTKPDLRTDAQLSAWLHRTALHVSIDTWRREQRRRNREQEAAAMETPETPDPWAQIAPMLDNAIDDLAESDRSALLLRFFERKTMRDVGEALGVSEAAAKMRVGRALERLRAGLSVRGVATGAAALAVLLEERSVEAVPAAVLSQIAAAKFMAAGASSGFVISGINKLIILMTKSKLAAALTVSVIGLAMVGVVSLARSRDNIKSQTIESADNSQSATNGLRPLKMAARTNVEPASVVVSSSLENAKTALRALLEYPQPVASYPPLELEHALGQFGDQWAEASPILLERLNTPDYETRLWCLYGIRCLLVPNAYVPARPTQPDKDTIIAHVRALVDPKLRDIFRSESEPAQLRRRAFDSLVLNYPPKMPEMKTPPPLSAETWNVIIAVLQSPEKRSISFRFEVLDAFSMGGVLNAPVSAYSERLKTALTPLLSEGTDEQSFFAAFALASLPGEKLENVKLVLLRELSGNNPMRYRVMRGLGRLGAAAADAVPALLKLGDSEALEAACRIQPELRTQHPEIDAKLKQEESYAASPHTPTVVRRTMSQMAEELADPKKRGAILDPLKTQIQQSRDPESQRALFLNILSAVLEKSTEQNRAAVLSALKEIRDLPAEKKENSVPDVSMLSVILQAKQTLLDQNFPASSEKMQELLNRWVQYYTSHPDEDKVNPESLNSLSQGIKGIDPKVHDAWRKDIMMKYPNVDRFLPAR